MFEIWRDKTIIYSLVVDDNTKIIQRIMGDDYIDFNYTSNFALDIQIGDFAYYNGFKYTVNLPVKVTKKSNAEFVYNVRFESPKYRLNETICKLNGASEFFLNTDAQGVLDLIESQTGLFYKGICTTTQYYNFNFKNESLLQVLNKVCEVFNVEWEIETYFTYPDLNYKINIRDRIGIDTGLIIKYKSGLKSLAISRLNDNNPITRLYAYGASKNLPANYTYKRLTIDAIYNNTDKYGTNEGVKVFENVYPHFEGSVDSVSSTTSFIDNDIDFDIDNYLVSGIIPKVNFLSGDLAGYEFEITDYNHATKTVSLKAIINDVNQTIPNTNFEINAGDRYTFIDIYMPTSYIDNAESELLQLAQEYLDVVSEEQIKYDVEIDSRYITENNIDILPGNKLTIYDSALEINKTLRIYGKNQSLSETGKMKIELTNEKQTSNLIKLYRNQYDIERTLLDYKKQIQILKNT